MSRNVLLVCPLSVIESGTTVLYDAKELPTEDMYAKDGRKQLTSISYNCTEDVHISADY